MKRSLLLATTILVCAAAGAASAQDRGRKDKDRDRPAPAETSRPAPRPQPAPRPAFQPAPRAAQPQPNLQRQERPAFQPPARPAPPAPRPPRPERPAIQVRPQPAPRDERVERPRPDRQERPAPSRQAERPAADRAPALRPTPNATRPAEPPPRVERRPDVRPRPDRTPRPARTPRAPRPAIAERAQTRARPDRAALPTRPDRARRPARPASPEAMARTRAIHQALRTQRARTYHFRGRTLHAHRVRPYRYPHGWRYRAWRRHQRFPVELFLSAWFLNDFLNYGLYAPPPGYRWVRYGPDAVLVDASSYDVADAAYGVFDDGSAYGGYEPSDLPPLDPDLPREFADGSFDLAQGQDQSDACAFFYGDRQTQDDIDAAWAAEDWNGLAKTVIWAGCGNDISYYLLGLAAEGLALPDAAANYYGRALDLADGDADDTFKCAISGPDACRGMDIGRQASDGLDRIFGPQQ